MIYLIGSLRNPQIPYIGRQIREAGFDVFDDWWSPGSTTDEEWKAYECIRGRSYLEALKGAHAREVFNFDLRNLRDAREAVLIAPAGKSAHLELGWMLGQGKRGYVLLEPENQRWDIMYQFATGVFTELKDLIAELESRK